MQRNCDMKRAAFIYHTFRPNLPVMLAYNAFANRKSQSGAAFLTRI